VRTEPQLIRKQELKALAGEEKEKAKLALDKLGEKAQRRQKLVPTSSTPPRLHKLTTLPDWNGYIKQRIRRGRCTISQ